MKKYVWTWMFKVPKQQLWRNDTLVEEKFKKKLRALNNYIMARLYFYFIVLLCVCCRPSISEEFQLPQNTDIKFKYFVAGLPFDGEFKVIENEFNINFIDPVQSVFSVKFDFFRFSMKFGNMFPNFVAVFRV